MFTGVVRQLAACQRAVVVSVALVPVVLATVACLPAVVVLPAFPGGVRRVSALLTLLRRWTDTVLSRS
ncbi:hypothetical protein [Kitasatospora griseola]|uniref:hypothetical protein n=1 Tax=Kitasatospora griseola TaxID=2064 RepID=UPI003800DF76